MDWSRLDFRARQGEMRHVLRDAIRQRAGSTEDGEHLVAKLGGNEILLVTDAIPAALSVAPARELVGQLFLRDHELAGALKGTRGGPVHIIACHGHNVDLSETGEQQRLVERLDCADFAHFCI